MVIMPVNSSLTPTNAPSPWVQYLGPLALSVLISWTTVSVLAGDLNRQVTANAGAITEQKETNKSFTTREETRIANEALTRELNSIHDDVRAIRQRVEKTHD